MPAKLRLARIVAPCVFLALAVVGACGGRGEEARLRTSTGATTPAATTSIPAAAFDAAHAPKLAVVVAAKDGSSSWIVIADAHGRLTGTLTAATPSSFDYLPRWSPDGRRLAFLRETRDGDHRALMVVDEDGSERELLTLPGHGTSFLGVEPKWSPDGNSVALDPYALVECSTTAPFPVRLAIASADGSGVRKLPALPRPSVLVRVLQVEWSPDGSELLYVVTHDEEDPDVPGAGRGTGLGSSELYAAAADGRGLRHIGGNVAWQTACSPDGAAIAFVGCEDDSCALQTVAADGSGKVRTVTEEVPGWMWASLAWPTPDEILHTDGDALYASDVRTGALRTVARLPALPDATASEILALSRDGGRVAVGEDVRTLDENRAQTIFVVDAATGAIRPVTFRSPTGQVGKPSSGAYGSVAVFLP